MSPNALQFGLAFLCCLTSLAVFLLFPSPEAQPMSLVLWTVGLVAYPRGL